MPIEPDLLRRSHATWREYEARNIVCGNAICYYRNGNQIV
jgi:hypothetical protein